jgi:hypothetical protein
VIGASLALAFAGAMAARRAVLEVPADFLTHATSTTRARSVARALAGAALVGAGVILLVLPGPGVLLITLGLLAWTRPLRALLEWPAILRAVNAFRVRHGRQAIAPSATPSARQRA